MNYNPANPLIVVADRTVLVEVDNPLYNEARDALAPFAELEKSGHLGLTEEQQAHGESWIDTQVEESDKSNEF